MKIITGYLIIILISLSALTVLFSGGFFPEYLDAYSLFIKCILAGGFGGLLYCIRGVYINYSAKKNWDKDWEVWYFIRPFASMICGGVSAIFLKAALLILEAKIGDGSSHFGFIALSFIAGLNVGCSKSPNIHATFFSSVFNRCMRLYRLSQV